jgi:hypothetical protein
MLHPAPDRLPDSTYIERVFSPAAAGDFGYKLGRVAEIPLHSVANASVKVLALAHTIRI